MVQSRVFRYYASDDSFQTLHIPEPEYVREVQVCLAFARDYDGINSTKGKYIPYWDTEKVTPEVITNFKERYEVSALAVNVLVSIGNNNNQFPFNIDAGISRDAWITEAIRSLTGIVRDYHLDGIDVNYEGFGSGQQGNFVHCIGEVIKKLKQDGVITVASIAPNADTNDNHYFPLYQRYPGLFDSVVFQCFKGFTPEHHHEVDSLKNKILAIANTYNQIKDFLVGYSAIREDWAKVSPSLFFLAISDLLRNPIIKGISIKVLVTPSPPFPQPGSLNCCIWPPPVLMYHSKTSS
ncbi:RuBisCO-associated protein [Spatholobus suberectus]|nr:RuBisCO-associated protein [Spatholobus suberectus]